MAASLDAQVAELRRQAKARGVDTVLLETLVHVASARPKPDAGLAGVQPQLGYNAATAGTAPDWTALAAAVVAVEQGLGPRDVVAHHRWISTQLAAAAESADGGAQQAALVAMPAYARAAATLLSASGEAALLVSATTPGLTNHLPLASRHGSIERWQATTTALRALLQTQHEGTALANALGLQLLMPGPLRALPLVLHDNGSAAVLETVLAVLDTVVVAMGHTANAYAHHIFYTLCDVLSSPTTALRKDSVLGRTLVSLELAVTVAWERAVAYRFDILAAVRLMQHACEVFGGTVPDSAPLLTLLGQLAHHAGLPFPEPSSAPTNLAA